MSKARGFKKSPSEVFALGGHFIVIDGIKTWSAGFYLGFQDKNRAHLFDLKIEIIKIMAYFLPDIRR